MARTPILAGLVGLTQDAGVASASQAADSTNGNILPFAPTPTSGPPTFGPFKILLAVTNGGTGAITVIVRASGYTGTPSGAANSGIPSPGNTVFTQATVGDLSVSVAASATQYIGPFTTDRFVQPNNVNGGDLWVDYSGSTSVTVSALLLPVDVV